MSSSPTALRPAAPAPQGAPGAAMSRTAEIRLVAGRELRAQLLKKSTLSDRWERLFYLPARLFRAHS